MSVYTPKLEADARLPQPDGAEPDRLQDPRRHRPRGVDRRHRRGLHPVRAADEQQGAVRPDPTEAQVRPDRVDDALRRLQPARLQPAPAVQDACAGGSIPPTVPDMYSVDYSPDPLILDVWKPAALREVHRPGRVGVRARALRARHREGDARLPRLTQSRSRRRGHSRPVPAAPYRGIHPFRYVDQSIFFAREEETQRSPQPGRRLPRRDALRRLRLGQVLAGQRRSRPGRHASRGSSPNACASSPARTRSSWSSGSPPTSAAPCFRRCSRPDETRAADRALDGGISRAPAGRLRVGRPLLVFDQFEEVVHAVRGGRRT